MTSALEKDLAARLAQAEARVSELEGCALATESVLDAAYRRCRELEAQLAANGKGGELFAVGDRVRVVWGDESTVPTVNGEDGQVTRQETDAFLIQSLNSQVVAITADRDTLRAQLEAVAKERDELRARLAEVSRG